MEARCPSCEAVYQIDDSKIPDKGAYATCVKCRKRFHIKNPKVQNGESKQKTITCPNCGHLNIPSETCAKCGIIFSKYSEAQKKKEQEVLEQKKKTLKKEERGRVVKETRATCNVCGHVWHYLPSEVISSVGDSMQKAGCSMMTCGCLSPFMSKTDKPHSKCPKCSSTAIKREKVEHRV